jgi:hypothetical protein
MAIPDHSKIVRAVSNQFPHLLAANTRESITELLWRSLTALADHDSRWGFLSKSEGENHTVIAGQRVALDAGAYRDERASVDFFGSAGDGPGKGSLSWGVDEHRRESNKWLPVVPFNGEPAKPIEPKPQPAPAVTRAELEAVRAQAKAQIDQARAEFAEAQEADRAAVDALRRALEALEASAVKVGHAVQVEGSVSAPDVVRGRKVRWSGVVGELPRG